MLNYAPLIAVWSTTSVPATYTGTALNAGMTTDQKLTAVNGWSKPGVEPPLILKPTDIMNAIVYSEWIALTTAQQLYIQTVLSMGDVNASAGTNIRTAFLTIFGNGTVTRTNLAGLDTTNTPTVPWVTNNGMNWPLTAQDLVAEGGLT
jgi:hypothetical protein